MCGCQQLGLSIIINAVASNRAPKVRVRQENQNEGKQFCIYF